MTKNTKINHKVNGDNFTDITKEIRDSGLNIKKWAIANGFPVCTVRFALAGYPRTERSAMIRREARKAVQGIQASIRGISNKYQGAIAK